jgi:hypothetical protein
MGCDKEGGVLCGWRGGAGSAAEVAAIEQIRKMESWRSLAGKRTRSSLREA